MEKYNLKIKKKAKKVNKNENIIITISKLFKNLIISYLK